MGVTGTAAAVNIYHILQSHKHIVGKPEDRGRFLSVVVDGRIILKSILQKRCDKVDWIQVDTTAVSTRDVGVLIGKPPKFNTREDINLLKPTGHVMHQQFNIQQL